MNPYFKMLADNRLVAGRRFCVQAADDEAEIFLYDAIVNDAAEAEFFGGIAPESFVRTVRDIKASTIRLRVNSPGGSVFAARAMEQALREHPARVVAHVDGVAASAATVVALAADEVVMGAGAMWMIHKSWSMAVGNADDLIETAALLEKIDGTLAKTYADRTGKPVEQIEQWMRDETWFTASEAVEHGFATSTADAGPAARVAWDLSAFKRAPQQRLAPVEQPRRANVAALLRKLDVAISTV